MAGRSPATTHVDDDDDDYTPPTAVVVDRVLTICPSCSLPLAKHDSMALLRCAQDLPDADDDEPVVEEPPPPLPTATRAPVVEAPSAASIPAPVAPHIADTTDWLAAENVATEPAPAWPVVDDQRGVVVLPSRELDYEELAAALRTVIERERDEIVRRGGPLEKQNAELKERLANALDEAALWRRRANSAAHERNTYKEQLEERIKADRKAKATARQAKEANHTRVLDAKELLAEVQKTPGFTVRRTGGGHFGIYKNDVWVVDMASSGQGQKVNMATRVALRKAGVKV